MYSFGLHALTMRFVVFVQQVANSGLQFVIVRTAKQAQDEAPSGSVALGPQSSLPAGSSISKSQVHPRFVSVCTRLCVQRTFDHVVTGVSIQ